MSASFDHCQELVRRHDKDRFLAALFVPAEARASISALYAFNIEVSRIRELVSGALPGEIRLQWWRDALIGTSSGGSQHGDVHANPVADALLKTMERYHLPLQPFLDLLEARVFDLYDDPMPSMSDLEGYAGETTSVLFQMAAIVLNGGDASGVADAAGHGGVAYSLTGLLRALPWHARRGQIYLPGDLVNACGVDLDAYRQCRVTPELLTCLAEMRAIARSHLAKAGAALNRADPRCAPVFLPLSLVEPYLAAMERRDYDPFNTQVERAQWKRQWSLWRASRRGF